MRTDAAPAVGVRRPTALVIGSDTRAFLTVVRSLGRQGVQVHAAPFDFSSPALRSRYLARVHRLPAMRTDDDGDAGPRRWIEALVALCADVQPDVVIPCDDRGILPMQAHAEAVRHLRLALPGQQAFEAFFDKGLTRELATRCGVPVAPGQVLGPGDTAPALVARYGLPLFVKPRRSYVLGRLGRRQNVQACHDVAALQSALDGLEQRADYLVEACLEGVGVGVSVLAADGVLGQVFQHRRLREPVGGGGSSHRQAEAVDPTLERHVRELARASRLNGVAMFEFRVDDATGRSALLEVNARPWGSLPLAVAAGVDFPWLWMRQLQGLPPLPRVRYALPCSGRNLMADFYAVRGHAEQGGGRLDQARALGLWCLALLRAPLGLEHLDTLVRDDRAPGWAELGELLGKVRDRASQQLPGADARRVAQARAHVAQAWRMAHARGRPLRVAVACWGNICRSPYAAERLRERLGPGAPVEVLGAALAGASGRPAPALAQQVAESRGIDLRGHQSLHPEDEALEACDLLVVFDSAHVALATSRGLRLALPPLKLRALLPGPAGRGDIADPVDGDAAVFQVCYRVIDEALDALVDALRHAGLSRS